MNRFLTYGILETRIEKFVHTFYTVFFCLKKYFNFFHSIIYQLQFFISKAYFSEKN